MSIGSASLFFVHIHLIHCHGFHVSDAARRGRGRERERGRSGLGGGSLSLPPPPSTLPLIIEEFLNVIYEEPLAKKIRTLSHIYDACD
jgi:hypothetical protein